jgi:glycosyltransferase involved in cell wall biosynthesis
MLRWDAANASVPNIRIMKIAILGTRGIPANYGGFETFAEECAAGLVSRGHEVTVYCRSHYVTKSLRQFRGARLVVLPTLELKYSDTPVHTLLSVAHSLFCGYDAVLICNAANSIYAWLPRLMGIPVVVNVDGIERRRRKWNWLGITYYRVSERFSTWFPNAIVTDARVIEQYYRDRYQADSVFISYGAVTEKAHGTEILQRLGVAPRDYFLYVSRLEPENNAHLVIAAFESISTPKKLIIVGDAPYARDYIRALKQTHDPRILFPGAIYGNGYRQLQSNAFCYIHATEVGGTHPALLEAMGQGNMVIANGTAENIEVLGDAGLVYEKNNSGDLARLLQEIDANSEKWQHLGDKALNRAKLLYSWEDVVTQYERLFHSLVFP